MKKWLLSAATLIGLANAPGAQGILLPETSFAENAVHVSSLNNGVKTYIQRNDSHRGFSSFRVVLRNPSCDQVLYAHDGYFDSLESADHFFDYCRKKVSSEKVEEEAPYFCSSLALWPEPEEIAVVAVGDFCNEGMHQLIQKHFSHLPLKESSSSEEAPVKTVQITQDDKMFKVAMHFNFSNASEWGATDQNLEELWKHYLIKDLFESRLERCAHVEDEAWIHPHPRFLRPVSGYALVSEESSEHFLSYLLWQKQAVVADGFTEEEFYVAKRNLLMSLQYLSAKANDPDAPFLAGYYVDQFLMGRDGQEPQEGFFNASCDIVSQIQFDDLTPCLSSFFNPEKQRLHLVYPQKIQGEMLTAEKIDALYEHLEYISSFYAQYGEEEEEDLFVDVKNRENATVRSMTSTISNREAPEFCLAQNLPIQLASDTAHPKELFYQLPISDREKGLIDAIILTMAEKNVFQLAFEKKGLEKKGKRVNGVHPLRFIGYIFSTPGLKSAMRTIRKSSFKWDGFLGGFSKRMRLEYENNNLFRYVPGFCELVHADPAEVSHYIHKKDWEGLIISLL